MQLTIESSVEPFSPAARRTLTTQNGSDPFILARTQVWYELQSYMREYVDGQLAGMSVLVCGHRGSGKTTMVHSAFSKLVERIRVDSPQEEDRSARHPATFPILVPLHAREIFRSQLGDNVSADEQAKVLIHIIRSVYSEVVEAFSALFLKRLKLAAENYSDSTLSICAIRQEAANLQHLLGHVPNDSEIRHFWEAHGLAERGILDADNGDQGIRELQALSFLCELFRKAEGWIVKEEEDERSDDPIAGSAQPDPNAETVEISSGRGAALTGIASFVMAQAGGGFGTQTGKVAAILGGLAALASVRYVKPVRQLVAEKTERNAELINDDVPDEFRLLMRRFRDAGFPLLFFVDELDKVDDELQHLEAPMDRFKTIFGESAFFCFAAARSLHEGLRTARENDLYSKSSSWFRRTLFVSFPPEVLHEYVSRRVIARLPEPAVKRQGYTATAGLLAAYQGARREASQVLNLDREALQYILLYRARMHMLDLHREMTPLVNQVNADTARGRPGRIRSAKSLVVQMYLQLVAETIVSDDSVAKWIERDASQLQQLYDRLYQILYEVEDAIPGQLIGALKDA